MTRPSLTSPPALLAFHTATAAFLLALPLAAQENAPAVSEVELLRNRPRLSFGAGIIGGSTAFTSDPLIVKADLGQIPAASLALRVWIEEYAGFDLSYQGGFLGGIQVTQLEAVQGDPTLNLTCHRIDGGFRYRFFSSPRPDAVEFGPRLGFTLHSLLPADHTPNVLIDTTYFGPQLSAFLRLPLASAAFGVDLEGGAVLPFFIREAPVSSGRPDGAFGAFGAAALWIRLGDRWLLQLKGDLRTFTARFAEQGERFGGVTSGENSDLFFTGQLGLERIF